MTSFMSLLTGSSGGTGNAGGPALPFAPERADAFPSDVALAYASVLKAPPMAYAPHWSSWGAAFGGGNSTNGNPSVGGSHDITARTGGFAAGLDYHASPGTIFGVAMAGGGTNWSLSAGLGGGRSDVFLAGLYGSKQWGQAYVSGALTYASNWVSTSRIITVAGADALSASFNAQNFGGRLEGGYRIPSTLAFGVSPYAAMQAQASGRRPTARAARLARPIRLHSPLRRRPRRWCARSSAAGSIGTLRFPPAAASTCSAAPPGRTIGRATPTSPQPSSGCRRRLSWSTAPRRRRTSRFSRRVQNGTRATGGRFWPSSKASSPTAPILIPAPRGSNIRGDRRRA
jgi:hypothetical protein